MQLIGRIWLNILKKWRQLTIPMRLRAQGVELGAAFLCELFKSNNAMMVPIGSSFKGIPPRRQID